MFKLNTKELKVVYNALAKFTEGDIAFTTELKDRALEEYNKLINASEITEVEESSTVEVKEEVKEESTPKTEEAIEEATPAKKAKKASK